jgi:hypothetical protein
MKKQIIVDGPAYYREYSDWCCHWHYSGEQSVYEVSGLSKEQMTAWMAAPGYLERQYGMTKAKSLYEEKKNLVWTSANMDWSVFAKLGDEKYKKGDFADLVHGEPIYLKPPNITTAKINL